MLLNRLRSVSTASGFSAGIYLNTDGCTFPPINFNQRVQPDVIDVDNENAMETASRRLAENNLLMKSLPTNVMKSLEEQAISKTELNVAMAHMIGNLNNIVPGPGLSAHGVSNVINNVYNIFLQSNYVDHDCYHHIAQTIHQSSINSHDLSSNHIHTEQDNFINDSAINIQKIPVIESPWNKFKNEPGTDRICAICQDVLASPQILNCGHSFCGICLHEYKERCTSFDAEVCYNCPRCREQITQVTFQSAFDSELHYKIKELLDCPEKEDWKQRNDQFDELNYGHASWVEWGHSHEEEELRWEESILLGLCSQLTVSVAFAVIILIYFSRRVFQK